MQASRVARFEQGAALEDRGGGARHALNPLNLKSVQAGPSACCGQVAALEDRGGARDTRLVLDGAHTPAAAAALAATLRRAFPDAALGLVVGMAADKDAAGVMAALRRAAPVAVAFTQAPIAGGLARCASMARLLLLVPSSMWEACACLSPKRSPRIRTCSPIPSCRLCIAATYMPLIEDVRHAFGV